MIHGVPGIEIFLNLDEFLNHLGILHSIFHPGVYDHGNLHASPKDILNDLGSPFDRAGRAEIVDDIAFQGNAGGTIAKDHSNCKHSQDQAGRAIQGQVGQGVEETGQKPVLPLPFSFHLHLGFFNQDQQSGHQSQRQGHGQGHTDGGQYPKLPHGVYKSRDQRGKSRRCS